MISLSLAKKLFLQAWNPSFEKIINYLFVFIYFINSKIKLNQIYLLEKKFRRATRIETNHRMDQLKM